MSCLGVDCVMAVEVVCHEMHLLRNFDFLFVYDFISTNVRLFIILEVSGIPSDWILGVI